MTNKAVREWDINSLAKVIYAPHSAPVVYAEGIRKPDNCRTKNAIAKGDARGIIVAVGACARGPRTTWLEVGLNIRNELANGIERFAHLFKARRGLPAGTAALLAVPGYLCAQEPQFRFDLHQLIGNDAKRQQNCQLDIRGGRFGH